MLFGREILPDDRSRERSLNAKSVWRMHRGGNLFCRLTVLAKM